MSIFGDFPEARGTGSSMRKNTALHTIVFIPFISYVPAAWFGDQSKIVSLSFVRHAQPHPTPLAVVQEFHFFVMITLFVSSVPHMWPTPHFITSFRNLSSLTVYISSSTRMVATCSSNVTLVACHFPASA